MTTHRVTLADGTSLAYHRRGEGPPVVCLPGGPGQASEYLGHLGGLDQARELVLLDLPGTGQSDPPASPYGFTGPALVEVVRQVLDDAGIDHAPVLGHSAGGRVALACALADPLRFPALVMVTSAAWGVVTEEEIGSLAAAQRLVRADEAWYAEASEAWAAQEFAGPAEQGRLRRMVVPFSYGRWDDAARAHAALLERNLDKRAMTAYGEVGRAEGAAQQAALPSLAVPVLLVGGSLDQWPSPTVVDRFAAMLPSATAVVLEGASHHPWLDTPSAFVDAVSRWLAEQAG